MYALLIRFFLNCIAEKCQFFSRVQKQGNIVCSYSKINLRFRDGRTFFHVFFFLGGGAD